MVTGSAGARSMKMGQLQCIVRLAVLLSLAAATICLRTVQAYRHTRAVQM